MTKSLLKSYFVSKSIKKSIDLTLIVRKPNNPHIYLLSYRDLTLIWKIGHVAMVATNQSRFPPEMLKTEGEAGGFQHFPQDLANVNAWKIMFIHYNDMRHGCTIKTIIIRLLGQYKGGTSWMRN